jgi:hypothetical protein
MVRLTRDDVIAIVGPIDDFRVARIIASGADPAELSEAYCWVNAGSDVGADFHRSLSGRAAAVYEILSQDEPAGLDEP